MNDLQDDDYEDRLKLILEGIKETAREFARYPSVVLHDVELRLYEEQTR